MEDTLARRRKSRVSIFVQEDDKDEIKETRPKQEPDQEVSAKKLRTQASPKTQTKGFSKPVTKKKKHVSIEFIPRDSETLEARIPEPSLTSKTWRYLTEDIIEPEGTSAEEAYVYHARSLAVYVLHVILVFSVIYGTLDLEYNYHSIIMSDLITMSHFESSYVLKTARFRDIREPEQIWDFIRSVMLKILYPVEAYNNSHSILVDNLLVGVAQLRQVRVKSNTCVTGPLFKDLYKTCYGYLGDNADAEDTEPFGLNTSRPWRYSVNLEKKSRGKFFPFSGSGFAFNFSKDYNWTVDRLKELERNQWIRLGTRAVFLDFATFCPNSNTFLVIKMTFEIMPWGGVHPTLNAYSIKLITSFNDAEAYALLGLDLVLFGYTVGLNYIVFLKMKREGLKKCCTFYNFIDVAIITSTYATLGVHVALAFFTNHKLEAIVNMVNKSEHPSFGVFINTFELYLSTAAVLLLSIVLKFIRYTHFFNETAKLMICALNKVKGELICFTIINVCILFGFSFVWSTIYGTVYPNMATPLRCLMDMIHNHARSFKIYVHDNLIGTLPPPLTILLTFTAPAAVFYINCISIPTYVALVVHGWQLAARDCSNHALRIKASEMTLTRIVIILEKLRLFKCANRLQEKYIIQMNEDDYYPMTEIMRRYGWTRLEIRLLLRKYGIRKGDDLTIDELFEVYQDFWTRNILFLEVNSHNQLKDDLEYVQRMVRYTESTVADLKLNIERLADGFLSKQKHVPRDADNVVSSSHKSLLGRIW